MLTAVSSLAARWFVPPALVPAVDQLLSVVATPTFQLRLTVD